MRLRNIVGEPLEDNAPDDIPKSMKVAAALILEQADKILTDREKISLEDIKRRGVSSKAQMKWVSYLFRRFRIKMVNN
ncbi:hypothetical protein L2750_14560 [Shewanella submarina]|uniref:Uncharacterized protein n=1 Tax=Shewanella submarina TaxID=2016376 RepID=A0ABV7G7K4_9GAMM|nr:hypothetical protein [Shewanella submarina]MCL1038353.1 hypothetical protein [Shewanella submarina]